MISLNWKRELQREVFWMSIRWKEITVGAASSHLPLSNALSEQRGHNMNILTVVVLRAWFIRLDYILGILFYWALIRTIWLAKINLHAHEINKYCIQFPIVNSFSLRIKAQGIRVRILQIRKFHQVPLPRIFIALNAIYDTSQQLGFLLIITTFQLSYNCPQTFEVEWSCT